MDYFLFSAVAKRLAYVLPGRRVKRAFQHGPLVLGLELDRKGILLFDLNPSRAGVYLMERCPPLFRKKGHLDRFLEALIKGGLIEEVAQVPEERILHLKLVKRDLLGDRDSYTMVAEIMGRHSNLMILDEKGKILEAAKRVYRDMSRVREVLPGRFYVSPPNHGRQDPFSMDKWSFLELLVKEETPILSLKKHALFPTHALAELESRANIKGKGPMELLGVWRVWTDMVREVEEEKGYLYRDCEGFPQVVSPLPLTHRGDGQKGDLLSLLATLYMDRFGRETLEFGKRRLRKAIKKELKRVQKILDICDEEGRSAKEAEKYKKWGESLFIHLSRIPPGARTWIVEDPYQPGEKISIPLPGGVSHSQVAQRYFKTYTKLKRKARALEERRRRMKMKREFLEDLDWSLDAAQTLEDLENIHDDMAVLGLVKFHEKTKRGKPVSVPYRVFRSSTGSTILVGRNVRGNMEVTFRLGEKWDLWFHVRGYPGAHVILKNRVPQPQELEEAAVLAARFSKAHESPGVDVDYVQRRYVRKVPGTLSGLVTYSKFSSIHVSPSTPLDVKEVLQGGEIKG
jgi:predicted ribosome quality control (RQC) complex YloA/Tae2 family protein